MMIVPRQCDRWCSHGETCSSPYRGGVSSATLSAIVMWIQNAAAIIHTGRWAVEWRLGPEELACMGSAEGGFGMQYVLGGLSFVGFLSLARWGCDMPWLFAITTGLAWATAVWSFTVLLKDLRFRKEGSSGHIYVLSILLTAAASLGLTALPELDASVRTGLVLLIFGVGVAGMGLGMLGGAAVATGKEKPQL